MELDVLGSSIRLDDGLIGATEGAITRQVREYERGHRREFDLRVAVPATFTGSVMAALRDIPYGETRTYADVAAAVGSAPIAVGQACGRNPVPLVVPCHRVVGADGDLRGYSAAGGIEHKRRLLEHEATVAAAR